MKAIAGLAGIALWLVFVTVHATESPILVLVDTAIGMIVLIAILAGAASDKDESNPEPETPNPNPEDDLK